MFLNAKMPIIIFVDYTFNTLLIKSFNSWVKNRHSCWSHRGVRTLAEKPPFIDSLLLFFFLDGAAGDR